MKKLSILMLGMLLLVLVAGCSDGNDDEKLVNNDEMAITETSKDVEVKDSVEEKEVSTDMPTEAEKVEETIIEETTTEEATEKATTNNLVAVTNESLKITSPQAGDTLSNPFLVKGEAKTADGKVYLKVKNLAGDTLIKANTNVFYTAGQNWGTFSVNITYQFTHTTEGTLEIYEKSVVDESEVNVISLPVKFVLPGEVTPETGGAINLEKIDE